MFVHGKLVRNVNGVRYIQLLDLSSRGCPYPQPYGSAATYLRCHRLTDLWNPGGKTGMVKLGKSTYMPMIEFGSDMLPVSYSSYTASFGRLACMWMGLPSLVVLRQSYVVYNATVAIRYASGCRELDDCSVRTMTKVFSGGRSVALSLMCLNTVGTNVQLAGSTNTQQMGLPRLSAGDDSWIGVCFDRINSSNSMRAAQLICKKWQMSSSRYQSPFLLFSATNLPVERGQYINVEVTCARGVDTIYDCDFGRSCSSTSALLGLACPRTSMVARVSLRLIPQDNNRDAGYLLIRLGGVWGYVCKDGFTNVEAKVACRNMSKPFSGARTFVSRARRSVSWVWLDGVTCNGDEHDLLRCDHKPFGDHNCNVNDAVAIECRESYGGPPIERSTQIRLTGGSSVYEGRVEVLISGLWRTICDATFLSESARVVCRNLGYPSRSATMTRQKYYPVASGPIYSKRFACFGNERYLADCYPLISSGYICDHDRDDIGVICSDDTSATPIPDDEDAGPTIPKAAIIVLVCIVVIAVVTVTVCYARRRWANNHEQRRRGLRATVPSVSQSVPESAPPPSYSMYLRYDNRNGVMNMGFQAGDNPPSADSAGAPPTYEDLFPVTTDDRAQESEVTPPSAPLGVHPLEEIESVL